jgi:hypothetical protein
LYKRFAQDPRARAFGSTATEKLEVVLSIIRYVEKRAEFGKLSRRGKLIYYEIHQHVSVWLFIEDLVPLSVNDASIDFKASLIA